MNRWITVVVLLSVWPAIARGQEAKVVLRVESGDTLAVVSVADSLVPKSTLEIEVKGDVPTDFAGAWHFALNGIDATREGDAAVYAVRVPDSSAYELTFRDDQERFSLKPIPMPRKKRSDAEKDGSGSLTVSPAVPGGLPSPDRLYDRRNNYVNLLFLGSGLPDRQGLPRDLDDNDVIHVYLDLPDDEVEHYSIQVTGTLKGAEVNVLGSGGGIEKLRDVGRLHSGRATSEDRGLVYFGSFGPYASPDVKFTILRKEGEKETMRREHQLRVNPTYVASLRFGVGRSDFPLGKFDVVAGEGEEPGEIVDAGDEEELRTFAMVVFYAWRFWEHDPAWNGRDIEEEPAFAARLNPVVGVGLEDLGEEYVAGLSLEIARGLDVFGAWHFAKTKRLAGGLEVGDPFTGEAQELPLRDRWERGVMWGGSVDVRIAVSALSGLLGSK